MIFWQAIIVFSRLKNNFPFSFIKHLFYKANPLKLLKHLIGYIPFCLRPTKLVGVFEVRITFNTQETHKNVKINLYPSYIFIRFFCSLKKTNEPCGAMFVRFVLISEGFFYPQICQLVNIKLQAVLVIGKTTGKFDFFWKNFIEINFSSISAPYWNVTNLRLDFL